MIVQCPSCSTKFSVDSEKIGNQANPRFHCSRCDSFFDLQGRTKKGSSSATTKVERQASAPSPTPADPLRSDRKAEQLDLLTASTEQIEEAFIATIEAENEEGESTIEQKPVTVQWPDSYAGQTHEADLRGVRDTITPGAGIASGAGTLSDLSVRRAGRFKPAIETKTQLLSNDDLHAPSTNILDPNDDIPAQVFEPAAGTPLFRKTVRAEEAAPSPLSVVPFPAERQNGGSASRIKPRFTDLSSLRDPNELPESGLIQGTPPPRASSSGRGMALSLSIPMVLTILFGAWSIVFNDTAPALATMLGVNREELPRLAPTGLDLAGVQAEETTLSDGQKVFQVRGIVVNATDKSFRNITIEGKLFDSQNRTVGQLVVPAASGLPAAGSLASLTSETMEELQLRNGVVVKLKPGDRLPFRMVFTKLPEGAVWYSARIYTVKTDPAL